MLRRLITTAALVGGLVAGAAPASADAATKTVTTYDMKVDARGGFHLRDTWAMDEVWTKEEMVAAWSLDGTTQAMEFVDGEYLGQRGASVGKLYATANQRVEGLNKGETKPYDMSCDGRTTTQIDGPDLARGRAPEGDHLFDLAKTLVVQIGKDCEHWLLSEIDFAEQSNLQLWMKLPIGQDSFTVPLQPKDVACPFNRPDIDSCTNTWSGTATFTKTGERQVDEQGRTVEQKPAPAPAPAPPAPPAPQPPAGGGTATPAAPPAPPKVSAGMRGPRAVFVTVKCAGPCRGWVELFPGRRTTGRSLADESFARFAAGTSTVKLRLSASEARALRRANGGRVVVRTERLNGARATRRVLSVRAGR